MSPHLIELKRHVVSPPHSMRESEVSPSALQAQRVGAVALRGKGLTTSGLANRIHVAPYALPYNELFSGITRHVGVRWSVTEEQTLQTLAEKRVKEAALQAAREKLGEHAAYRLERFMTYQEGWDSGRGGQLQLGSLEGLTKLLAMVDLGNRDAAIFMSPDGNVVVNWHRNQGSLLEIEIFQDTILCFDEAEDSEAYLSMDRFAVGEYFSHHE